MPVVAGDGDVSFDMIEIQQVLQQVAEIHRKESPTQLSSVFLHLWVFLSNSIHHRAKAFLDWGWWVGIMACKALNLFGVIRNLGLCKLESMCCADNYCTLVLANGVVLTQLDECC